MHQQVAVGVGHGVGQLQEEVQALSQRQGLYRFIDRLALHVLQHEVGQALFAGTGVQQARDVRVAQARQRLALLGKALQHGGAVHAAFQQLDGGATLVAAVAAARLEDLTHAAGADGPYHLPCAQSLADSGSRPGTGANVTAAFSAMNTAPRVASSWWASRLRNSAMPAASATR